MTLSRDEIRTIAVTSAVAAVAAAAGTAFAEWVVRRYILQDEDHGPQFVVVPVQQQPPPGVELPPANGGGSGNGNGTVHVGYRGLGASPQMMNNALAVVPRCHSESFDECLESDNRYAPECLKYEPLHRLYEADEDAYEDVLNDIEYCDHSKEEMWRNVAVAVGGGAAMGYLLASVMA